MSHRPARLPMLRPRQVHDAEEGSRHASWLELFFDLVFVVAVAQLAVALHHDHDLRGFLTYAGLFVPIWWAWISFSYFSDLFDDNRPFDRLVQLAAMFGIAVVAVSLAGGITDDAELFAGAFGAMFVLLGVLYLHAARTAPDIRQFCRWYAVGSFTGAALWLTSMAVPEPGRIGSGAWPSWQTR